MQAAAVVVGDEREEQVAAHAMDRMLYIFMMCARAPDHMHVLAAQRAKTQDNTLGCVLPCCAAVSGAYADSTCTVQARIYSA